MTDDGVSRIHEGSHLHHVDLTTRGHTVAGGVVVWLHCSPSAVQSEGEPELVVGLGGGVNLRGALSVSLMSNSRRGVCVMRRG